MGLQGTTLIVCKLTAGETRAIVAIQLPAVDSAWFEFLAARSRFRRQ
jgi:hypothetical protein